MIRVSVREMYFSSDSSARPCFWFVNRESVYVTTVGALPTEYYYEVIAGERAQILGPETFPLQK